MNRDELVAKVAWAFEHAQRTSERCSSGLCVACGSAAAVDAVLSAVADDLKARRDFTALPPFGISNPKGASDARFALGAYAHFLRSMTDTNKEADRG